MFYNSINSVSDPRLLACLLLYSSHFSFSNLLLYTVSLLEFLLLLFLLKIISVSDLSSDRPFVLSHSWSISYILKSLSV